MSLLRIVSFDVGLQNTGCVIVDTNSKNNIFEIVSLDLVSSPDNMHCDLFDYIKAYVEPMIDPLLQTAKTQVLIIYENVHTRKLYPNWKLIRLQKDIRSYFSNRNIRIKAIQPSQKAKIGGQETRDRKTRKQCSVKEAQKLISECGCFDILDKFNAYNRNHDIADALLAARYMSMVK